MPSRLHLVAKSSHDVTYVWLSVPQTFGKSNNEQQSKFGAAATRSNIVLSYSHDQSHSHRGDILTALDTHSSAYRPRRVYTSFHVCRESCYKDLEGKNMHSNDLGPKSFVLHIKISCIKNHFEDFGLVPFCRAAI